MLTYYSVTDIKITPETTATAQEIYGLSKSDITKALAIPD